MNESIPKEMLTTEQFSAEDVIVGKHVFGNLYGIDPKIASDEGRLREIVLEAVRLSKTKLVELKSWSFGGRKGGVSVIALVEESHIALHTWVEYGYATVDVYTCGEYSDPWAAFKHIVKELRPKYYTVNYADRSGIMYVQSHK